MCSVSPFFCLDLDLVELDKVISDLPKEGTASYEQRKKIRKAAKKIYQSYCFDACQRCVYPSFSTHFNFPRTGKAVFMDLYGFQRIKNDLERLKEKIAIVKNANGFGAERISFPFDKCFQMNKENVSKTHEENVVGLNEVEYEIDRCMRGIAQLYDHVLSTESEVIQQINRQFEAQKNAVLEYGVCHGFSKVLALTNLESFTVASPTKNTLREARFWQRVHQLDQSFKRFSWCHENRTHSRLVKKTCFCTYQLKAIDDLSDVSRIGRYKCQDAEYLDLSIRQKQASLKGLQGSKTTCEQFKDKKLSCKTGRQQLIESLPRAFERMPQGEYLLYLSGGLPHAVYVKLDEKGSYCCDANDYDFHSLVPNMRKFQSRNDLSDYLAIYSARQTKNCIWAMEKIELARPKRVSTK